MDDRFLTDFRYVLIDKDKNMLFLDKFDVENMFKYNNINTKNIVKNKNIKFLLENVKSFILEKK